MKKGAIRAELCGSGFIRTTLAPVNDKQNCIFSIWDAFEILGLVFGIVLVMRFLLAQ